MKRILFISMLSLISAFVFSQENLIKDGSFEKTATVAGNQLPRIAAFSDLDGLCQTQNPAVDPATTVERGKWYRKSPNSGYLKGAVTGADSQDGDSSLLLSIDKNSTQANLDKWYNNVLVQYVKIDRKKKYVIKFYVRTNENCDKIYAGLVSGKGGSVKGSKEISINDEWTEYTLEVSPAAHPDKGQFTGADMEKACLVIGMATKYENEKTTASSVFIDNVRMYESK